MMPVKPIIMASEHFIAPVIVFPVAWKESKLARYNAKPLLPKESCKRELGKKESLVQKAFTRGYN
jgi:hypothetical protein